MTNVWRIQLPACEGELYLALAWEAGNVPSAQRVPAAEAAWRLRSFFPAHSFAGRAALFDVCAALGHAAPRSLTRSDDLFEAVQRAVREGRLVAYWREAWRTGAGRAAEQEEKKEKEQTKKQPWSLVNLAYVTNVAPGKEDPKPKIKWSIKDPSVAVTEGKFELFRKRDPEDAAPIWTQALSTDQLREGDHELEWDGQISAHADFPDSYVTIEYSPYRLKLTVSDGGKKQDKEAKFEVTVVDFEIELGDKAVLSNDKDKALYDAVKKAGALPAASAKRKLNLISNLFKTSSSEMDNSDTASFDEYKTLWDEGARIPIDAKVWIKDSKGGKVLAPKAWGKRTIVWDWECVDPDLSGVHADAKTYCEQAQDYSKDKTKPKGQNSHKDRGGKRSDDGTPAVFTKDSGGTFPFNVTAASTRKHAALSEPAKTGDKEGLSGVVFRPARQAGDGYKLTAYFDPSPKKELDKEGKLEAAFKKATGTFEVWREIHLSRYIKKKATISGFTVATVQGYYDKAFVRVEDKTTSVESMAKAAYDAAFTTAINAQPAQVKDHAIDKTISQYDGGDWAVTFRSHADFRQSQIDEEKKALKAATPALTDAQATTQATATVDAALAAASLDTAADYADKCSDWALDISQQACDAFMGANDGVTIIQFALTDNQTGSATGVVNGYAPSFTSSSRSKVAFIQYAPASQYASGGDSNTMEQTISHEIGHHMFLPHAPLPATSLPGGADADAHDQADTHCLMGYDYTAERKFCGKCLLRMRGWDHTTLDKDGSKNKKS